MARTAQETPLQRQYRKIKEQHPGAILLFRMGDFYETFDDDAKIVAQVLGITLTKRSNGNAADTPLAGFPYHSLDQHLPKLVQAGHRVALCEQLEDPKLARTIVRRDVVEVITPGVILHDGLLDPRKSTFVLALRLGTERGEFGRAGLSFLDVSTGEFFVTEVAESRLGDFLQSVAPAEILVDKRQREAFKSLVQTTALVTPVEDWTFGDDFARETLLRHFKTHSLKGFGVDELPLGLKAAGAVLYYVSETQRGNLPQVRRLQRYNTEDFMVLDAQTKRNLELVAPLHAGQEGSLMAILDHTRTPMGARLLRTWLVRPLRQLKPIHDRLDAIGAFVKDRRLREQVREALGNMGDLERLAARVSTGRATPRDVFHVGLTLRQLPAVKALLAQHPVEALAKLAQSIALCIDVADRIERTLNENPPLAQHEGGLIRAGFSPELDEYRHLARSGKDYLAKLERSESERTGISSLKVGFNRVFGYYIEITNAHKDKIPPDYIRKQTLVNAERYITPALKEYEEKILGAEEKGNSLELQLFQDLRLAVAEHAEALSRNAQRIARLDVLVSLAEVADRYAYVRPVVDDSHVLDIREGRHPVVERTLPPGEPFIPNDLLLDPTHTQMLLITGPNMAGKSVVLRQVGLIVLLAQVGSFVPAASAHIGLVDRIFTRVGASDNLAAGESTFLVEMNEAANILNNATPASLILLDEVGRGTSTFDGLSIAWALVEYLHERPEVSARTLFATHYHELNDLAERLDRVRSACVNVELHEGKLLFLRRLVSGGSDHSYGIDVARMAGLPEAVIRRAREVLAALEAQHEDVTEGIGRDSGVPSAAASRTRGQTQAIAQTQISLFDLPPSDPKLLQLREAVLAADPNRLTPIEALLKLAELKALAMSS